MYVSIAPEETPLKKKNTYIRVTSSKIKNALGILVVCFLLAVLPLTSSQTYRLSDSEICSVENSGVSLAYSNHGSVIITRNSDFETQDWPGQGSSTSPYLISNLNITSESVVCILIANTTSYFKIQNCWLGSQESEWGRGIITFENVINGRVENNIFAAGYIAISAEDSSRCTFSRNTISTSMMGFLGYNLVDSEFSDNTQISDSMGYAVHIEDSNNVDIFDNLFDDCLYEGIGLTSCTNCYVADNALAGANLHLGQYGVAIRNSRECSITRNNVTSFGTAIDIVEGLLHTISMNYVSGCWGGISLRGNDTIISDNEISVTGFCVQLRRSFGTNVNSNELSGTVYTTGVDISGGGNNQVFENEIYQLEYGMRLQGVVNLEVSTNSFSECFSAITFEEIAYIGMEDGPPVNCRILNNQIEGSGFSFSITDPIGMNHEIAGNLLNGRPLAYLYGATNLEIDGRDYGQIILADCEDVSITGGLLDQLQVMFCTDCEISGVSIINSTNGIFIRYSSRIDIGYSLLVGNDVGVRIEWSSYCHIISTTAHNNGHGLLLDSSPDSTVYDCELYDNEYGLVLIGAHRSDIESNLIYENIQGIFLLRTTDSFIGNNDVLENDETGLLLNRGSRFNTIVANSFGWNSINVICSGLDNMWDDGVKRGNRWSDLGDSIIYMIDEDDFDRFPSILGYWNSSANSESTSNETNIIVIPEIVTVAIGAVSGFSLLGLFALAVRFGSRRRNSI
ncbi:hypothetical protein EU528_10050 [Candidatus Thorarchaeota archaeon]|nr:MAG: hypothetical protein EU528_10050 [Candidatus Thorarchaeota archaeon]